MNTLLSIVAIFFASQISNFQYIIGKYEIQDESHFSTIELKKDKSFIYEYRGSSCSLWHDKIGKWDKKGNTLVLIESFEWKEEIIVQINSTSKIEMRERIEKYEIVKNELIGFAGNSLDSGMKFKKKK